MELIGKLNPACSYSFLPPTWCAHCLGIELPADVEAEVDSL